jgi:hypothetical protein
VETEEQTLTAPARTGQPAGGERGQGRSFVLVPDRRGAAINSGLYVLLAAVSLYVAVRLAEPNSVRFYVLYFVFFLALFQGFTVVARHCLHRTPKSVVRIDIVGKKVRVTRRSGAVDEITRDLDYTRRKGVLVLQGKTHDNQKVSEVIRAGALEGDAFENLVTALKRFR